MGAAMAWKSSMDFFHIDVSTELIICKGNHWTILKYTTIVY